MIRQGCCWTGYSEQSYSNRIGITAPSLPPSFSLFPPSPSFSFFSFFLFLFFLVTRQVWERMDAFALLVPELSHLASAFFSSPLQTLFPCWLRFHQEFLKRQWTMLVTLSFAHLFSVSKKKLNTQTKTTVCSCCAATSVRGFLSSLANINEFSLAVSLCRKEGLSSLFHSWGNWGAEKQQRLPGHTASQFYPDLGWLPSWCFNLLMFILVLPPPLPLTLRL